MHVGGGLHYVDGPQGHGKSYFGLRKIVRALLMRRYVATNIPLLPGWAERIARHDPYGLMAQGQRRRVQTLESLYLYTTTIGDVLRFDLPCGRCGAARDGNTGRCSNGHRLEEGRGLCVWDESHNDVGNRSWNEAGRETLLKGSTQFRKLGWTTYLITQHEGNTDKALRRVAGWRIRMTNQRERARVLGMRILPWPFFIASYFPANDSLDSAMGDASFYERFLLRWPRKLYDTHGLYSGLSADLAPLGGRVRLPPPGRALAALAASGRTGSAEDGFGHGGWWRQLEDSNRDADLDAVLAAIDHRGVIDLSKLGNGKVA